jgi:hypothetical protein
MEKERIEPWYYETLSKPTTVAFERIVYEGSGMQIYLREVRTPKRLITLSFSDLPTAVRIANESQRLVSLRLLPKDNQHSFYLVKNSSFLAWLNDESLDIYKNDPLFHLAIITDEWIDLVCNEAPTILVDA